MVTVDDITIAVIILVRIGVIARFIFCMVKLTGADEDGAKYKMRAKNAIIFYIIAESCFQLRDIVMFYYG